MNEKEIFFSSFVLFIFLQEVEPNIGRMLCKLFPDDENVKLGSKRRSSGEKEHKRMDQGSPRLEFASFWVISRGS
jgi:hypothetical protein